MTDTIIKLPQDLILKIAAGEVVERPASVVKELVENSIDAGATAITIDIQDGGIKYIRVMDNGSGIRENMLSLAFERHSTSKIKNISDLFRIKTLGFRGEALSSISAVSQMTLSTKHESSASGVTITNFGGVIQDIRPSSINIGTNIVINNLFYNTPVRLKFLKKPSVEASYVTDLIMRLILSHPEISFRYINNGKIVYHSIGDGNLVSAIARVYDAYTAKNMLKVDYSANGLILKGYIGVLELEKNNKSYQSFYINGRFFKDTVVSNALEDGAKGYFTISKHPMCVLNLIAPYDFVDVNVHPNKLEVRFEDNEKVYNFIKEAIEDSVNKYTIQTKINQTDENTHDFSLIFNTKDVEINEKINNLPETFQNEIIPSFKVFSNTSNDTMLLNDSANTILDSKVKWYAENKKNDKNSQNTEQLSQKKIIASTNNPIIDEFKIIGSVFDTFIIVEYKNKCLLIDQHAAQERLNYEKMMKAYEHKSFSQQLITPMLIELNSQEAEIIRNYQETLYNLGFNVSFFDESSIAIRAVPIVLGEPMSIKECFNDIFKILSGKTVDFSSERVRERILQSACKHAIKARERISDIAIYGLVNELLNTNVAPTCPHGRPIFLEFTEKDLYKMFKRIQ